MHRSDAFENNKNLEATNYIWAPLLLLFSSTSFIAAKAENTNSNTINDNDYNNEDTI